MFTRVLTGLRVKHTLLGHCLSAGDDRAFHRVHGDARPLMVTTMSSLYHAPHGQQRQYHTQALIYWPLRGKQLLTREDVERYLKGEA
jgi:hypothetical protein